MSWLRGRSARISISACASRPDRLASVSSTLAWPPSAISTHVRTDFITLVLSSHSSSLPPQSLHALEPAFSFVAVLKRPDHADQRAANRAEAGKAQDAALE